MTPTSDAVEKIRAGVDIEMIAAEFIDHLFKLALARKGAAKDETGWLCELPSSAFGPSWWCVPEHEFTTDASKALRFARKQDAEDYIAETGEWTDVIATEHMWPALSAAEELLDKPAVMDGHSTEPDGDEEP
jgi:hypothetical protein